MTTPSFPTPSTDATRAVRAALAAVEAVPDLKKMFFDNVAAGDVAIPDPIPTYSVGLDAIHAGKLTEAASFLAWRYLLGATLPSRLLATADLCMLDNTWTVTGFNSGPLVDATEKALTAALGSSQWLAGGLELRILQVPALYTLLLWLHGGESNDYFVAVVDPEQLLKAGVVLDEVTVMKTLSDIATHYEPVKP